eukprot:7436898-Alexandrium_andersonii.AAC.1
MICAGSVGERAGEQLVEGLGETVDGTELEAIMAVGGEVSARCNTRACRRAAGCSAWQSAW